MTISEANSKRWDGMTYRTDAMILSFNCKNQEGRDDDRHKRSSS